MKLAKTTGQQRILRLFKSRQSLRASDLATRFGISRQAVHRHLKALARRGIILKCGTSRKTTFYVRNTPVAVKAVWKDRRSFRKRYRAVGLKEDAVYREISLQPSLLGELSQNATDLFHYAFTEMVNNAIEHARSRFVDVLVDSNPQRTRFVATDYGVGIYENIRAKKGLSNEMEALQDLLKGKQTTLPEYHSGEGIFFTSKVADRFVIESHRKRFIIDNRIPDIFVEDVRNRKGTTVSFEIDNRSSKKLEEIFRQYTGENFRFEKSRVLVKLFQEGEPYVSRSQAKRLLHALDRFQEITLDFQGVTTIGQGFADEIFRVFASHHPKTKIIPVNGHENVLFMINRARTGANQ